MSEKITVKTVYFTRDLKRVENISEVDFTPATDILTAVERAGEEIALAAVNDVLSAQASKAARSVPADGIMRSSVAKFCAPHRNNPKFAAIEDKAAQTAAMLAEFAAIPFMVDSLVSLDAALRKAGAEDDAVDETASAATA